MSRSPARRARRWFWALTLIAIVLAGALSRAVMSPAQPATGITVAALGMTLAAVVALDVRVLLALTGRLR